MIDFSGQVLYERLQCAPLLASTVIIKGVWDNDVVLEISVERKRLFDTGRVGWINWLKRSTSTPKLSLPSIFGTPDSSVGHRGVDGSDIVIAMIQRVRLHVRPLQSSLHSRALGRHSASGDLGVSRPNDAAELASWRSWVGCSFSFATPRKMLHINKSLTDVALITPFARLLTMLENDSFCGDSLRLTAYLRVVVPPRPQRFARRIEEQKGEENDSSDVADGLDRSLSTQAPAGSHPAVPEHEEKSLKTSSEQVSNKASSFRKRRLPVKNLPLIRTTTLDGLPDLSVRGSIHCVRS